MKKKIAVLVSGGGSNLQALIDAVKTGYIKNAEIVCVISNKPEAYALERAKKSNIETVILESKDIDRRNYTQKLIIELKSRNIDLICLAGFMLILDSSIINAFKNKIMNIHPALLPSYGGVGMYGHHVHEAVHKAGEKVTGATVHFVDEGTDTGSIILQKKIRIMKGDTPEIIAKKVLEVEHEIYPKAVKKVLKGEN